MSGENYKKNGLEGLKPIPEEKAWSIFQPGFFIV
jgi:hypothetical protein